MRYLLLSCLTLGMMLSATGGAVASTETLDRVATQAQSVRREAEDVRRLLSDRKTDLSVVMQRVSVLESQAQELKEALAAASSADTSNSPAVQKSLQNAQAVTDSLMVLLANKSKLLADAERAQRERGLLRAKAIAIAKRAAMVEQHVSRMRG